MAAKIGGSGIPEYDELILKKMISYCDKKAVEKEIIDFEKQSKKKKIETACVVTKDGEVVRIIDR